MKGILARVSGLSAILTLFLLVGAATTARPAYAQAEQVTDQDKAVHYSLYYEEFKNQNFAGALPNLKWIIENAPGYPRNDDRNFERLVETYAGLATQSDDPETKRAYLDSALVVFETVGAALQENGIEYDERTWTLEKGRFIQKHADALQDRIREATDAYRKVFEMASCELDPYYVRVIIDDHARAGEKQEAVEMTDQAEQCYSDNAEMMAYITQVRNALFESPEERMTFLEGRLAQNPDDVEVASELFDIYLELEERQKAAELGQRLAQLDESARTLRMLGQLHLQDGEAQQALEYYERALALPDADESVKRDILYNMGIAQQQLGRLSAARSSFRNALQLDPKFGQALIAIGDLYATAVSECGSFEPQDRAVYWLAVDYYERAKSADPSVASQANQKISTYRRTFPDQEALFFRGWEPGQAYRIDYGCYTWINESTTIKSP